ncbi:hypothetical protein Ahy_B10g104127 isoform A [Arachis hypogaea]|uniref:Protein FAR1-RELATED SEQUENCE n=1 Tax=Arachis hypogaea TaxID=3818 RepID=A0A444X4T6_ARAHY|nr:hypothetical protein Ahy_B10g104127 isoform A [Arachis hypogaea]
MCILMRSLRKFKHNLEKRTGFKLTFNKFVVTYDAISCELKWQCFLFESTEQWSNNVKRRHTHQEHP